MLHDVFTQISELEELVVQAMQEGLITIYQEDYLPHDLRQLRYSLEAGGRQLLSENSVADYPDIFETGVFLVWRT